MNAPAPRRRYRIQGQRAAPGWVALIALIALVAMRWQQWGDNPAPAPPVNPGENRTETVPSDPVEKPQDGEQAVVRRVVDGDTLLMQNGDRVRLLGVDTPETKKEGVPVQPWGPEANDFTTRLAEGKTVRLEFDRERFDQYQRILAYVYVGDVLLNEEVIRQGFSKAQTQYPFRSDMKKRFVVAQEEAQRQRRGIWTIPPPRDQLPELGNKKLQ